MKPRLNALVFPLLMSAVLLVLFAPVLDLYHVLNTPDSAPYYYAQPVTRLLNWFLRAEGGRLFYPGQLPALLLPPLVFHDLHYALCTIAVGLAALYYLRGIGLNAAAAACGGFAMAFSGYHFTLISAGHRGYFDMMPWAILLLAAVDRTLRRPHWRHMAVAAASLGFGLSSQPDVMALFVLLTAGYAVWVGTARLRVFPAPERTVWLKRQARCLGIALPMLLLATYAPLEHVFRVLVPHRQAQLTGTAARPSQAAEPTEPATPTPEEAWLFATNWSLPPSEALEFVAPFFFGIDTGNPDGPYWGALGRHPHWDTLRNRIEAHLAQTVAPAERSAKRAQWLSPIRNLRQHTTYLGGIQALFAVFAGGWVWIRGKRSREHDRTPTKRVAGDLPRQSGKKDAAAPRCGAAHAVDDGIDDPSDPGNVRSIARFWTMAAATTLLLAFGRYTPLYRVFYALPMMDKLRAPVKFFHLTELAVAVLFGVGVHLAMRASALEPKTGAVRRRMHGLGVAGTMVAVLFALAAAIPLWRNAMQQHLALVGMLPAQVPSLVGLARRALVHAALATGVGSGLLLAVSAGAFRWIRVPLPAIILGCVMVDVCLVARPFIRAVDVAFIYAPNPLIHALLEPDPIAPYRVSNRLTPDEWFQPIAGSLRHHAIPRLESSQTTGRYAELVEALAEDPDRLWAVTGTRFILGDAETMNEWRRHPRLSHRMTLDLDRRGRVVEMPAGGRFSLLERGGAEPFAQVFHDWEAVAPGQALDAMKQPDAPFERRIWIEADDAIPRPERPDLGPAPARTRRRAGISVRNRTRIEVRTEAPAMLLVRTSHGRHFPVTVNDQPVPSWPANHAWTGIPIDRAGAHVVKIDHGRAPLRLLSALTTFLLLIAAAVSGVFAHRRRAF